MNDQEQDAPSHDLARAAKLVPHVRLVATRLLELRSGFVPSTVVPEPPYTIKIEASFAWVRRDDGFSYSFKVEVNAGPEDHIEVPFWTCVTAQELTYLVKDVKNFADEDAAAFGNSSGLMAAWPYLREVVQSISTRSGLAPVILDVIRFSLVAPQDA